MRNHKSNTLEKLKSETSREPRKINHLNVTDWKSEMPSARVPTLAILYKIIQHEII
jgi:hypothetical protein